MRTLPVRAARSLKHIECFRKAGIFVPAFCYSCARAVAKKPALYIHMRSLPDVLWIDRRHNGLPQNILLVRVDNLPGVSVTACAQAVRPREGRASAHERGKFSHKSCSRVGGQTGFLAAACAQTKVSVGDRLQFTYASAPACSRINPFSHARFFAAREWKRNSW